MTQDGDLDLGIGHPSAPCRAHSLGFLSPAVSRHSPQKIFVDVTAVTQLMIDDRVQSQGEGVRRTLVRLAVRGAVPAWVYCCACSAGRSSRTVCITSLVAFSLLAAVNYASAQS